MSDSKSVSAGCRRAVRSAVIEAVESRRLLSVSVAAPVALPATAATGTLVSSAAGDFGNGHPDLAAVYRHDQTPGELQTYLNDGAGNFSLGQLLTVGRGASYVRVADIDNDAVADVLVSNPVDGSLDVFRGTGGGMFNSTPVVVTVHAATDILPTTFLKDPFQVAKTNAAAAFPSILIQSNTPLESLYVLTTTGNAAFTVTRYAGVTPSDFAVIDTNSDGFVELIGVADEVPFVGISAVADGTFVVDASSALPRVTPSGNYTVVGNNALAADANGDGSPDLFAAVHGLVDIPGFLLTSGVASFTSGSGGTLGGSVVSTSQASQGELSAGDFDGDGKVDLLVTPLIGASSATVLGGGGDGTFKDASLAIPMTAPGQAVPVADFNGDGKADFVAASTGGPLSFYAGGNNGVASGGALTPTVSFSTLPSAAVSGKVVPGKVYVNLVNGGASTVSGVETTTVYAAPNGVVDANAVQIGSARAGVNIKAGKSRFVSVPVKLPIGLGGNYTVIARTTSPGGSISDATGSTIAVTAPFITYTGFLLTKNLTGAAVSGEKTKASASLTLTNTGNVPSTKGTISVYVSTDGTVASGVLVRSVTLPAGLKPGRSRTISVPFKTLPAVADGQYEIVATAASTGYATVAIGSSGPTVRLAAPFVTLTPTITSFNVNRNGTATAIVSIANAGNVASAGRSVVTTFPSADGVAASAASFFNLSIPTAIQPGKSRTQKLTFSSVQVSSLQAAGFLLINLQDPNAAVTTASKSVAG